MIVLDTETVEKIFEKLGLPFRFSLEEKRQLITTGVVVGDWRGLGFPTPTANPGLNILNLRKLLGVDPQKQPSFFDHPWYLEEDFARTDCEPGWHFISMEPQMASLERPFNYQSSVEMQGLTLPSAVEVVLMLFLHYVQTGEHLLLKKHTWCRDKATLGRFVTVGAFGRNGVFISSHPPTFASRGLGICGKLIGPRIDALSH